MTSDMDDRQGEAMKPSPSPAATSGNNMDNFTDDASPKAGVPTGSGAVGFTTQTDLRQYRQIRQTLLYGAELAKRYVGNESSVTAPPHSSEMVGEG